MKADRGTIMKGKIEATERDLENLPEEQKAELVQGELLLMSPTGGLPGFAGGRIVASLNRYARRRRRGHAIPDNVGFLVDLPNRRSFSPDAAYHVGSLTMKFVQGAPRFAAEVRSEDDYGPAAEREMADKRADYFAAGTLVVWDVDLLSEERVRVYRASDPERPTIYRPGDVAEAEPAVPGWRMKVDDLLP
jgi:Uma2 family endonuclease